jgi:hypothetical protein
VESLHVHCTISHRRCAHRRQRGGCRFRSGCSPSYTQVNLGVSHAFQSGGKGPRTARVDVINAFDKVYQIRSGSGVGVFAPQYGPRRGVFGGLDWQF